MDLTQKAKTSALALSGRNARKRRACDRTAALRVRLLTGDVEAAQATRDTFRILYWEHRGNQIFPLHDERKDSQERADR